MNNRMRIAMLVALLTAALLAVPVTAGAEEAAPLDEWTVLIYLCGSDLESQNAMATFNLMEINKTMPIFHKLKGTYDAQGLTGNTGLQSVQGRVNLLIETGGCSHWHAKDLLGLDIATDRLQRYEYDKVKLGGFVLADEQPLQSMSDPRTLAEFIRWGVAARPARRIRTGAVGSCRRQPHRAVCG